ncbi:hypothetical protein PoB_000575800 [Plakobranchus ocellatus]|uniref:Uncharacterized protein n=1 Tax=Plakobranchus ocellatus TaxID=259542 RepID=A0AAV3YAS9_9GAST|nr:hypothetical protein PoB_000575800 [Plakobranchus ocellatus]
MKLRLPAHAFGAIWTFLLLIQCLVPSPTWAQTYDLDLQARAQTIDDLRYLIGPNFSLFIAAYWRYMIASCDIFGRQLNYDMQSGLLLKSGQQVSSAVTKRIVQEWFESEGCNISRTAGVFSSDQEDHARVVLARGLSYQPDSRCLQQ